MNASSCLQGRFLTLLPRIEKYARYHFRDQRCPNQKADRIAEVIALAWKWFVELEQRGKEVARFVTVLASLAARAVRSGRRLAGMEPAKDVLSERAQQRRGFQVISLPEDGFWPGLDDALCDSTQTPPADAAAFCCVDSIATRRMIWESVRSSASFFVDGRMSAEVLRVLAESEPAIEDYYQQTLFAAGEAHVGACTARSTIYTASIAAGLMVHQFAKWLRRLPLDADLVLNLLAAELTVGGAS
jgi:hypothetical protein